MSGLTMIGISCAVIGILVVIWGATLFPIDLTFPDFMSFTAGGIVLLAVGLCMISYLPSICKMSGIWLAAVMLILYLCSFTEVDFVVKIIGFIPILALAVWLSFKLWD
ncbi:hypothetical protein [Streptococcus chenjunshii]|nr:hypothetical protein [Streptococcus chenjunshii]